MPDTAFVQEFSVLCPFCGQPGTQATVITKQGGHGEVEGYGEPRTCAHCSRPFRLHVKMHLSGVRLPEHASSTPGDSSRDFLRQFVAANGLPAGTHR